MNEPIHANCLAEVVWGTLGDKSPNLGLIVKVLRYVGDDPHPDLGRIWRCEAEFATPWATHPGASDKAKSNAGKTPPGQLDFAQTWLRKLPDPPPKAIDKVVEKDLETT